MGLEFLGKLPAAIASLQKALSAKQALSQLSKTVPKREMTNITPFLTARDKVTRSELEAFINKNPTAPTVITKANNARSAYIDDEPIDITRSYYNPKHNTAYPLNEQELNLYPDGVSDSVNRQVLISTHIDPTDHKNIHLVIDKVYEGDPERISMMKKLLNEDSSKVFRTILDDSSKAFDNSLAVKHSTFMDGVEVPHTSYNQARTQATSRLTENNSNLARDPGSDTRYFSPGLTGPHAEDPKTYAETLLQMADKGKKGRMRFMGPHWDETNIGPHIRSSENAPLLYAPKGEKNFHMTEAQYDWGQAQKRHGNYNFYNIRHPDDYEIRPHLNSFEVKHKSDDWDDAYGTFQNSYPRQDAKKAAAKSWNQRNSPIAANIPPAPYGATNEWEPLAYRTALAKAIKADADNFTWPMASEFTRRGMPQSGAQAQYDNRTVNYFNKILKPYNEKVTHDRVSLNTEMKDVLRDPNSGFSPRGLVQQSKRVHKFNITPEMKKAFGKVTLAAPLAGVLSQAPFNSEPDPYE